MWKQCCGDCPAPPGCAQQLHLLSLKTVPRPCCAWGGAGGPGQEAVSSSHSLLVWQAHTLCGFHKVSLCSDLLNYHNIVFQLTCLCEYFIAHYIYFGHRIHLCQLSILYCSTIYKLCINKIHVLVILFLNGQATMSVKWHRSQSNGIIISFVSKKLYPNSSWIRNHRAKKWDIIIPV